MSRSIPYPWKLSRYKLCSGICPVRHLWDRREGLPPQRYTHFLSVRALGLFKAANNTTNRKSVAHTCTRRTNEYRQTNSYIYVCIIRPTSSYIQSITTFPDLYASQECSEKNILQCPATVLLKKEPPRAYYTKYTHTHTHKGRKDPPLAQRSRVQSSVARVGTFVCTARTSLTRRIAQPLTPGTCLGAGRVDELVHINLFAVAAISSVRVVYTHRSFFASSRKKEGTFTFCSII